MSLGRFLAWNAKHPSPALAIATVLSLAAGAILVFVPPEVETDVQAGTFPRGDPQAEAFRALRSDVAGINSELVYLELAPDAKVDGVQVDNVTDLAAVRAVDELFTRIKTQYQEETGRDDVVAYTGYPYLVKLVYSYFPDGGFRIPEDERQYRAVEQVLTSSDDGSLAFYFSSDYRSTIFSIVYDPEGDKSATAGRINEIIAEIRGEAATQALWDEATMDSWGIQSWIYRVDEEVGKEVSLLVPVIIVLLTGVLVAVFRDVRRALTAMMMVGAVQLWTLAAMTAFGLPIGFISMALFPLLLGVGVDYAIHVQHEAMREHADPVQGLRAAGSKAGTALVVATLTTVAGFVVIMQSRSPMIIEVSTATIIGMSFMLVACLALLPALMGLIGGRAVRPPGMRWLSTAAAGLGRRRGWTVLGVAVALVLVLPFLPDTAFAIDTVEDNLPRDAHMLDMYVRFQDRMDARGQESFIHQGDLTDPFAIEAIIQTHLAMEAEPLFRSGVLSLPFVLQLWSDLEGDPLGPAGTLPQLVLSQIPVLPQEPFADVRAMDSSQLRGAMQQMWDDPRWTVLIRSFTDEAFGITWTFSFLDEVADTDLTKEADAIMAGIRAGLPDDVTTHYFGTLTALYRINEQAAHWLRLSAVVDLVVLAVLVALVTRSVRAVSMVVLILGAGMAVWLSLLASPWVEIRISFVYLIPLAFITSLGSDYAVHLALALQRGERAEAFKGVGRAIIYSAGTTALAFLVFAMGKIPGSSRMFIASVLAILTSALLTLVLAPVFYPPHAQAAPQRPRGTPA